MIFFLKQQHLPQQVRAATEVPMLTAAATIRALIPQTSVSPSEQVSVSVRFRVKGSKSKLMNP